MLSRCGSLTFFVALSHCFMVQYKMYFLKCQSNSWQRIEFVLTITRTYLSGTLHIVCIGTFSIFTVPAFPCPLSPIQPPPDPIRTARRFSVIDVCFLRSVRPLRFANAPNSSDNEGIRGTSGPFLRAWGTCVLILPVPSASRVTIGFPSKFIPMMQ